jgi:hypothetical protein
LISLEETLGFLSAFVISDREFGGIGCRVTSSIVMIENGHGVNIPIVKIFTDYEAHVAHKIFTVEDQSMVQLSGSPSNILRICKTVVRSRHDSDWKVDILHVVVWRSGLPIFGHVFLLTMVKPSESRLLQAD